jgi:hypothetical protein
MQGIGRGTHHSFSACVVELKKQPELPKEKRKGDLSFGLGGL